MKAILKNFKDIIGGKTFPEIPIAIKIRDLDSFIELARDGESALEFQRVDLKNNENRRPELVVRLEKPVPVIGRTLLPNYQLVGSIIRTKNLFILEGRFFASKLSNFIFSLLGWACLIILMVFFIFFVIFILRSSASDTNLLFLFIFSIFFCSIFFLTLVLYSAFLMKIELKKISEIKKLLFRAAQGF